MKSTGIVRKTDNLSRLVIPKELTRTMDIPAGTPVEIFTEGNSIILRKYAPGCTFCGNTDKLVEFGGQHICGKCRNEIRVVLKKQKL